MTNVKRNSKKLLCLLLVIVNIITVMFAFPSEALASYSAAKPLPTLVGDAKKDLIAVLKSQIGYSESQDGETIYAAWAHGIADSAWCSEYVVWCANKAKIPKSVIPMAHASGEFFKFYNAMGLFYNVSGGVKNTSYVASNGKTLKVSEIKAGDILLCEGDGDATNGSEHTAFCYKVKDGVIYTYEGNMDNRVQAMTRKANTLHGICRPAYSLTPADISTVAKAKLYTTTWNYKNTKITPTASVKTVLDDLILGEDYKIIYKNNLHAGTATASIVGLGDYAGSIDLTFTILPSDIANTSKAYTNRYVTYDGKPQTVGITLTRNFSSGTPQTLTEGKDYTVSGNTETNGGIHTLTVTGKGDFTGSFTKEWTIKQKNQRDVYEAKVVPADGIYRMKLFTEQDIVWEGGYVGDFTYKSSDPSVISIDENGHMKALSPGDVTISVTASGDMNYKPCEHTNVLHVREDSSFEYSKTVKPTCSREGYDLYVNAEGLSYKANIKPKKAHTQAEVIETVNATCTKAGYEKSMCSVCKEEYVVEYPVVDHTYVTETKVVAKANYDEAGLKLSRTYCKSCGETSSEEEITIPKLAKTKLDDCKVVFTKGTSYVYNGADICPSVKVYIGDKLVSSNEYSISYVRNRNHTTADRTAYVRIESNNIYNSCISGTTKAYFEILPLSLSKCTTSIRNTDPIIYNGKVRTPSIDVFDRAGRKVSHDQYTVVYTNNKNAGTATYTVKAKSDCNFKGSIKGTFTIKRRSIESLYPRLSYYSCKYDGKYHRPTVTVTSSSLGTLVKDRDYKVTYSNNKNVGVATVTVKGIGNFRGTITNTFKIKK